MKFDPNAVTMSGALGISEERTLVIGEAIFRQINLADATPATTMQYILDHYKDEELVFGVFLLGSYVARVKPEGIIHGLVPKRPETDWE